MDYKDVGDLIDKSLISVDVGLSTNHSDQRHLVQSKITRGLENMNVEHGLQFYEIVCDERNNSPDILDQDDLRVDVYIRIHPSDEARLFERLRSDALKTQNEE